MSRRATRPRLAAALLAGLLALTCGCAWLGPGAGPAEVRVPIERLRRIEPLDPRTVAPDQRDEGQPPAEAPTVAELALTLQECRAAALASNLELKVELINPTIAQESVSEEEARFEPSLFASGAYSRSETPSGTSPPRTTAKALSADAGIEFPLHTGGSITLDVPFSRTETEGAFAADQTYSVSPGVTVSQPLLRGAGAQANTYSIRIARYESQITEARTKLAAMRVLAAVDRTYWRLYASRRELQVRKDEYDLAVAQLARVRRMAEAGLVSEIEIVRAEAGVAERLEAIIIADNAVRDRERELKRVLNRPDLPLQGPTVVVPATEPDVARYSLDPGKLTEAALQNRMELLELELRLAQDASTIALRRNDALPFLAVDYTYRVNGLGPTRSDALDMAFDRRFDDHSVGLALTVPLGNAAAEARLRRALYAKAQTLATRDQRVQQIEQEVATALDALESGWQRIVASRQRSLTAARNMEAEERQFTQGLRTSTEVLDAQTRLADAQSAEIRAETEYQISKVDTAFATGMLLGEAAVIWEPIVPEGE